MGLPQNTKSKTQDIKLFAFFVLLFFILGFSTFVFIEKSTVSISEERFSLLCKEKALEIDSFFLKTMTTINTVSTCLLTSIENEEMLFNEDIRIRAISLTERIFSAYLLHNADSKKDSLEKSIINAYIRFDPRYSKNSAGVFLGLDNDKLVHYPLTDIEQYDANDIEHVGWYYIPASSKKAIWIEPYNNKNINKALISYVMPLIKDKKVIGVIGIDLDIDYISELIGNIRVLKKGFAYLQTKSGTTYRLYENRRNAKNNITQPIKLKNDMTLVISIPKEIVYPARFSKAHYTIFSLYVVFLILFLIVLFFKIGKAAKEIKLSIKKIKMANYAAAVIVIAAALALQISTILKEKATTNKHPDVTITAKNTFEKTLRVTGDLNFPPYSFAKADGTYTGHDIELINELANRLGYNVELELTDWNEAQKNLIEQKSDILLGYEVLATKADPAFLLTEEAVEDEFVILGKQEIKSISDLKGKKIASISGTESYDLYNLSDNAMMYNNTVNELFSVARGENDYAIVRETVANMVIVENDIQGLFKVYDMIESHLGFALPSSKVHLQNKLNRVLKELKEDGTLLSLRKKWLEYDIQNKNLIDIVYKNFTLFLLTGIILFIALTYIVISHFKYKADSATLKGEQFRILSETDSLTGIRNRGAGEAEIKRLMMLKKYGMFCLFDADKFKSINDTFGHETGDKVIKGLANAMKRALREQDVFMRLGGDEFLFYTPGIKTQEEGIIVIKRLFDCIAAIQIPEMIDREISVSLGASFFTEKAENNGESEDFDSLYKKADSVLYKSKEKGGKSFSFYTDVN